MKTSRTAATGFRSALFSLLLLMTLSAYMSAPACAIPGGAGLVDDPAPEAPAGETPFDRQGMWIWYVSRSEGGDVGRIVSRARRAGIGTLYVKSGDAGSYWGQFSRGLVEALHRAGIDVCAWQFVYGRSPVAEAKVGAAAVKRGADCLVIDAEAHYEGRYAAADRYVRALRARIGDGYPLSLAGFPYVDYHPSFPYSVFFGPGGATANQPQMYWRAIGTSVRAVYEHTYLFNRLWGQPIYPLGQTYGGPGRGELLGFRRLAASYGGLEPSWWDWQETSRAGWRALGADVRPLAGRRPALEHPTLRRGARGDLVVWAQAHLRGAGARLPVSGYFGRRTAAAVRDFQLEAGLPVSGRIDTATWQALLAVEPMRPQWAARRARARRGDASAAASRPLPARRPLSARLPAKAYEIDPGPSP